MINVIRNTPRKAVRYRLWFATKSCTVMGCCQFQWVIKGQIISIWNTTVWSPENRILKVHPATTWWLLPYLNKVPLLRSHRAAFPNAKPEMTFWGLYRNLPDVSNGMQKTLLWVIPVTSSKECVFPSSSLLVSADAFGGPIFAYRLFNRIQVFLQTKFIGIHSRENKRRKHLREIQFVVIAQQKKVTWEKFIILLISWLFLIRLSLSKKARKKMQCFH